MFTNHSGPYENEKAKVNMKWCHCCYFVLVIPILQLGGAMAPAIKELSRWLDANSEYYVAPDWADVVKHSVSMIYPSAAGIHMQDCSLKCIMLILILIFKKKTSFFTFYFLFVVIN